MGVWIAIEAFEEEEDYFQWSEETFILDLSLTEVSNFREVIHLERSCTLLSLKNGEYYLLIHPPEEFRSLLQGQSLIYLKKYFN
jgi:hypothetical protein